MTYATADEVTLAANLGYDVECNTQRGHSFARGNRHVWPTREGWQTADLEDGYYMNHKSFPDLSEALARDLDVNEILQGQLPQE